MKTTVILLIISLLTGAGYFLYIKPLIEEKKRIEEFEKRFFRADIDSILLFKVDRGRGPVEVIKTKQGWVMTGNLKVDRGVMRKFLSTLSKGKLIKIVGDSDEKAKFGLDEPKVRIALGFKDGVEVLLLGDRNPADTGYYAYSENLGKVFLINREVAEGLAIDPYKLVEKKVFSLKPEEIGRIKMTRTKSNDIVDLMLNGENWYMKSPFKGPADESAVKSLTGSLVLLKTRSFVEWENDFLKFPWRVKLQIYDRSGRLIESADIVFRGTEWYKGVVVKRMNSKLTYRVRREFWNVLNRRAGVFYKRDLFDFNPDKVRRIEVIDGKKIHKIIKRNNRWYINSEEIPSGRVQLFLKELNSWKANIVLKHTEEKGPVIYSFRIFTDSQTQSITVYDILKDLEVSETKMFAPVKPGSPITKKVDFWLSWASQVDRPVVVNSLSIKHILSTLKAEDE